MPQQQINNPIRFSLYGAFALDDFYRLAVADTQANRRPEDETLDRLFQELDVALSTKQRITMETTSAPRPTSS